VDLKENQSRNFMLVRSRTKMHAHLAGVVLPIFGPWVLGI